MIKMLKEQRKISRIKIWRVGKSILNGVKNLKISVIEGDQEIGMIEERLGIGMTGEIVTETVIEEIEEEVKKM